MSKTLSVARTEFRWPGQVWAALKDVTAPLPGTWILHDQCIYAFNDLARDPWPRVCEAGTIEQHSTSEWANSGQLDRSRLFVQLLNRTLSSQLWPVVRYWKSEDCYAFAANSKGSSRITYPSLRKDSSISAITRYSKKVDERTYVWLRHMAFRGQFRQLAGNWYLEITPTYRFTSDGVRLDLFHQSRLMTIKRIEGNRAVLSSVLVWAHVLSEPAGIFDASQRSLSFGNLLTFDSEVGIADSEWLSKDPTPPEPKSNLTDDLFFSGIDGSAQS